MLSRDSDTKGFSKEALRSCQKGGYENTTRFCSCLNCVRGSNVSSHFMPLQKYPHPAPQYVWVGGQGWFHLLRNPAYYHSTEHKHLFIFITAQLKTVTAMTASLAPAHRAYLTACLPPQTNHL